MPKMSDKKVALKNIVRYCTNLHEFALNLYADFNKFVIFLYD